MKKALIFTGGGVTKVLNATIYGVVKAAKENKIKIMGGIGGWGSLMDKSRFVDLNGLDIEGIQDIGGTFLRSSRTNPFKSDDGIRQVLDKVKKNNIDYIIPIGGDNTMLTARKLFEDHGLNIVSVPKTIDNDLNGTYYTPGFPSAAAYISDYCSLTKRDVAMSYKGIFITEVMGGTAGWLAASGVFGDADLIIPPEKEVKLSHFFDVLMKKYEENNKFASVVVSKEAKFDDKSITSIKGGNKEDQYGLTLSENITWDLKRKITEELKVPCRNVNPGHIVSSGAPIAIDRDLAIELGRKSIELIKEKQFGEMTNLVRLSDDSLDVQSVHLKKVVGDDNYKTLPDNFFDYKKLNVTEKFFDYMFPILGTYKQKHTKYYQLLRQVFKHQE